jgi:hypothetical protein
MGKGAKSLRRDKHDRIRALKEREKRAAKARGEARKPAA